MTMRMPVQTPALNIPSMTEQPVSRKKELDIKKYVNFFFIVCLVCGYKIETIENGYSFEEIGDHTESLGGVFFLSIQFHHTI